MPVRLTCWTSSVWLLLVALVSRGNREVFAAEDNSYCSPNNTAGHCRSEEFSETCVDGVCKKICSSSVKDGYCEPGIFSIERKCINGTCKEECSTNFQDGYCVDTVGERRCVDGTCRERCSASDGNGFCDWSSSGREMKCSDGVCQEKCSVLTPHGYCDNDYFSVRRCSNGVCKKRCSSQEMDGYCNVFSVWRKCVDGDCKGKCSSYEKNGYCDPVSESEKRKCVDGKCMDACSSREPEGFCERNGPGLIKRCVNGICRGRCSYFDKKGYCDGGNEGLKCVDGFCRSHKHYDTSLTTEQSTVTNVIASILVVVSCLCIAASAWWCKRCCKQSQGSPQSGSVIAPAQSQQGQWIQFRYQAQAPPGQVTQAAYTLQAYPGQETPTQLQTTPESPAPSYQSVMNSEDPPPPYDSLQVKKTGGVSS